jgi:cyclic pyranopterin phosphate synthase
MNQPTLSHVDDDGRVVMVDVTGKELTHRVAEASCVVVTSHDVASLTANDGGLDPLAGAKLAGIHAAKNTSNLIPLCHPLAVHDVVVEFRHHERGVLVYSRVVSIERTGVEMEALAACSFAALSLVNALLLRDTPASFEDLVVLSKKGGASGEWGRSLTV